MNDVTPLIAILLPLLGAFLTVPVSVVGRRLKRKYVREGFVIAIMLVVVLAVFSMVPKVWGRGEIITYYFGGWVPPLGITLAIDGLNMLIAVIASTVALLVAIFSVAYLERDTARDSYYVLLLLVTAGTLGITLTGDLFNFYVFFEIMSISSYALIAFRRGAHAIEAGVKYLVVGSFGSTLILLGITLLYGSIGSLTMADLASKISLARAGTSGFPTLLVIILVLFVTGLGIKIAMVPFHAWLPDAYQAAPSSISALLSGATTVAGVYVMLRVVYVMFGALGIGIMFAILGLVTMVLGALMAIVQDDLKRLLAYSGVSQIGYVLLGIGIGTATGIQGGLFHLLNYAIFEVMLFMCAGAIAYRAGTTKLSELGGLGRGMPVTAAIFTIGALAISGVPPFNGFASKWIIYVAGVQAGQPIFTVIAVLMSALTLAYFLKVVSTIFLGPQPTGPPKVKEAPMMMLFPMFVLVVLCVMFGVLPQLGVNLVQPGQQALAASQGYIVTVLGG